MIAAVEVESARSEIAPEVRVCKGYSGNDVSALLVRAATQRELALATGSTGAIEIEAIYDMEKLTWMVQVFDSSDGSARSLYEANWETVSVDDSGIKAGSEVKAVIDLRDRPETGSEGLAAGVCERDHSKVYDDPEVFNDRGVGYHLDGQISAAVVEYQAALTANPGFASAHNNLGIARYALGEVDEAIREFRVALQIDPGLADVHHNLGIAYRSVGRLHAAIGEWHLALHIDPRSADSHCCLGGVFEILGWTDEAIEHYQMYLELAPFEDYAYKKQVEKKVSRLASSRLLDGCSVAVGQPVAGTASTLSFNAAEAH